jgi:hypothetical protein
MGRGEAAPDQLELIGAHLLHPSWFGDLRKNQLNLATVQM